ncbi:hypothetical protein TNIN_374061 [Trichonephila inaurata madagascariensis]|uniref:Uncharacterized protein n=1 Tax=Trichonephila inaurata madagascariensis TaxID=2747483 RepID=A0A8X6XD86_9ARAC|nr:hypothetical protein TNIN_374061 [Trichonephila inaurata madagascariensis]
MYGILVTIQVVAVNEQILSAKFEARRPHSHVKEAVSKKKKLTINYLKSSKACRPNPSRSSEDEGCRRIEFTAVMITD